MNMEGRMHKRKISRSRRSITTMLYCVFWHSPEDTKIAMIHKIGSLMIVMLVPQSVVYWSLAQGLEQTT